MSSFLIDPAEQTVVRVSPENGEDFLDFVRRHIGAPQVAVVPVASAAMAVWCDNMGLLKRNAYWRFADADFRYGGKALLTALVDGNPVPFRTDLTAEQVLGELRFHSPESLLRIEETVVLVEDEEGRPIPAIARHPVWADPAEIEKPSPPPQNEPWGWTVSHAKGGGYRAVQFRLEDDELRPMGMLTHANLEDLREMLPEGLERIEPGDEEELIVVEHWIAPRTAH